MPMLKSLYSSLALGAEIFLTTIDGVLKGLISFLSALKTFMLLNNIKPTWIAKKIGVSAPAICNLYCNTKLSPKIEKKIRLYYPGAFKEDEKLYKNPLKKDQGST